MERICIVVGAGDFHVSSIPVNQEDYVIAADGGYAYCLGIGIEPDLVLGDFDSLEGEGRRQWEELRRTHPERILILPAEKDDTDMLAAIKEGLKRGYKEFRIYGSQGGRLAHTIANIQCLNYLKDQGANGRLMEEDGQVLLIRDETITFPAESEGYLSLVSYSERAEGVTIRNMKYELNRANLTNSFPIGVSNEFVGAEGSVTVEHGTLLILTGRKG